MRIIKTLDGSYVAAYKNINLGEFPSVYAALAFINNLENNCCNRSNK